LEARGWTVGSDTTDDIRTPLHAEGSHTLHVSAELSGIGVLTTTFTSDYGGAPNSDVVRVYLNDELKAEAGKLQSTTVSIHFSDGDLLRYEEDFSILRIDSLSFICQAVPTDPTLAPTEPTLAPTDPTLAPADPTPAPTDLAIVVPTLAPTPATVNSSLALPKPSTEHLTSKRVSPSPADALTEPVDDGNWVAPTTVASILASLCCMCCAVLGYNIKRAKRSRRPEPQHVHASRHLEVSADNLGISYEQLVDVWRMSADLFNSEYLSFNLHDIVNRIIKPLYCSKYGVSYAEFRNKEKLLRVEAFVTHCWKEPFDEFVREIRSVFQHFFRTPPMFICAFALFQGSRDEIQAQLSDDIADAPFRVALQAAKYLVVMRNSAVDLYTRAWCVYEIICAKECGFVDERRDQVFIAGPDTFRNSTISCLDMKVSVLEDKCRIMKAILSKYSYKEIDDEIRAFRKFYTPRVSDSPGTTIVVTAENVTINNFTNSMVSLEKGAPTRVSL